ncbi:hypothetical protein PLICRDRAFT_170647 [Plicaturopsis crispa FD-325 SS-3]|nr:hypothetical protein PLICRDRAFT_170647 [Plicaturopsis crispa FD-325 SS-3]
MDPPSASRPATILANGTVPRVATKAFTLTSLSPVMICLIATALFALLGLLCAWTLSYAWPGSKAKNNPRTLILPSMLSQKHPATFLPSAPLMSPSMINYDTTVPHVITLPKGAHVKHIKRWSKSGEPKAPAQRLQFSFPKVAPITPYSPTADYEKNLLALKDMPTTPTGAAWIPVEVAKDVLPSDNVHRASLHTSPTPKTRALVSGTSTLVQPQAAEIISPTSIKALDAAMLNSDEPSKGRRSRHAMVNVSNVSHRYSSRRAGVATIALPAWMGFERICNHVWAVGSSTLTPHLDIPLLLRLVADKRPSVSQKLAAHPPLVSRITQAIIMDSADNLRDALTQNSTSLLGSPDSYPPYNHLEASTYSYPPSCSTL